MPELPEVEGYRRYFAEHATGRTIRSVMADPTILRNATPPALRDAMVLALPVHPLCREDCPGLCPDCGALWDELPADHDHRQVDSRWAALEGLKAPSKE